jgi:hypothetical protein
MVRDPMLPDLKRMEPTMLAEAVRQACIEAAQAAYEDARLDGLCHEGAWECAVDAIRSLDLASIGARKKFE